MCSGVRPNIAATSPASTPSSRQRTKTALERAQGCPDRVRLIVRRPGNLREAEHLLDVPFGTVESAARLGGGQARLRHARHPTLDGSEPRRGHSALAARAIASSSTSSPACTASWMRRCRSRRGSDRVVVHPVGLGDRELRVPDARGHLFLVPDEDLDGGFRQRGAARREHEDELERVVEQLHPLGIRWRLVQPDRHRVAVGTGRHFEVADPLNVRPPIGRSVFHTRVTGFQHATDTSKSLPESKFVQLPRRQWKLTPAAISTARTATTRKSTAAQNGGHQRVPATKWVLCRQRSFAP